MKLSLHLILPDYNVHGPQCKYCIKDNQLAGLVELEKFCLAEMEPLGNFLWKKVIWSVTVH